MSPLESSISVDGSQIFKITSVQKMVICDSIPPDELESDLQRRLQWVIDSKYKACLDRLMKKWMPILQSRYSVLPTDIESLIMLIHSQPDYEMAKRPEELPILDKI